MSRHKVIRLSQGPAHGKIIAIPDEEWPRIYRVAVSLGLPPWIPDLEPWQEKLMRSTLASYRIAEYRPHTWACGIVGCYEYDRTVDNENLFHVRPSRRA